MMALTAHLSVEALQGLKEYKYKAGGYTYLDDLHQPAWTYVVSRLPLWLAPNLITLMGTIFVVVAYLTNFLYLPSFEGEAPRWVYIFTAFAVFMYVNLDCIDGKQARRTGSSSPLGQLFDHGCDALVVHMVLGNIACSLNFTDALKLAVGSLSIMLPWIMAQLEEYHTGIMIYGSRFVGVLEANYAICCVHVITALAGPDFWQTVVPDAPYISDWLPQNTTAGDICVALVGLGGLMQASGHLYRSLVADKKTIPEDEQGLKDLGRLAAVRHTAYVLLLLVLGVAWMLAAPAGSPTLRATFCVLGISYAHAATQLIVAHMCKMPFLAPVPALSVLSAGLLNSSFGIVEPLLAASMLGVLALSWYLVYTTTIIREICAFLGIQCLTIPHPKKA